MRGIFDLFNLSPDFFRAKTTWVAAFSLVYVWSKWYGGALSYDQVAEATLVILFGVSLRDAVGKLVPPRG